MSSIAACDGRADHHTKCVNEVFADIKPKHIVVAGWRVLGSWPSKISGRAADAQVNCCDSAAPVARRTLTERQGLRPTTEAPHPQCARYRVSRATSTKLQFDDMDMLALTPTPKRWVMVGGGRGLAVGRDHPADGPRMDIQQQPIARGIFEPARGSCAVARPRKEGVLLFPDAAAVGVRLPVSPFGRS